MGRRDSGIAQVDLLEQGHNNESDHAAGASQKRTAMKYQNWRDFLRMKCFVRPYAWHLGLMILIGLAGSALGLAQPYLSKYLVDNVLIRRDGHALVVSAALMFAATIAGSLVYLAPMAAIKSSLA